MTSKNLVQSKLEQNELFLSALIILNTDRFQAVTRKKKQLETLQIYLSTQWLGKLR